MSSGSAVPTEFTTGNFDLGSNAAAAALTASMFVINKLGHRRGWTERPEALAARERQLIEPATAAVKAYRMWLADHPDTTESVRSKWFAAFARVGGVTEVEMVRIMKLEELTNL